MDAHSLAVELAPVIMWQKDDPGTALRSHLSYSSKTPSRTIDLSSSNDAWKDLLGEFNIIYYPSCTNVEIETFGLFAPIRMANCLYSLLKTIFAFISLLNIVIFV